MSGSLTEFDSARLPDTSDTLISLRELEFTDLYISQTGDVLIRGLEDGDGPLEMVPPEVVRDLDQLQMTVFAHGQNKKEFFIDYDGVRYRVSRIRAQGTEWFTLRKSKAVIPRLGKLGGFPHPVIKYLAWLGKHHGLIVISGATGQGKTTTAYSLLREYLLAFGDIAVTIEDPPEMILEGPHGNFGRCFQLRLDQGEDFGSALHDALRHTPRYIFMGELRKSNDASQALRAAISGHLVITTIHAGSIEETINSLLKLTSGTESEGFARELLANGLAGVIHQQLVRSAKNARSLKVRYLFTGGEKGIRSLIRDGSTNQLGTFIEQQASRVLKGLEPVDIRRS